MELPNIKTKKMNVSEDIDVAYAALCARIYAKETGFSKKDQYMIATAVSELARNIFVYAKKGTIYLKFIEKHSKRGVEVVAEDSGPGIGDIEMAMKDNFSTGGTMGVGLPGTKRLMDDFQLDSHHTHGTKVIIRKWI